MKHDKKVKIDKYLQGIYNLSPVTDKKPFFSKTDCPCCGDELKGDRYTFTGIVGKFCTGEKIELVCCIDCYVWLFN